MNNGAYGLVPAALRETGRTMRDIVGIHAQGRIAEGRQGLEMEKLRYGLGKDERERAVKTEQLEYDRYMETPMTVEDIVKTAPGLEDPMRQKIMNSDRYKLVKGQTTTPKHLATVLQKLETEKRAEARADKLAVTKRTQELADAAKKREHEIKVAQVKADRALEKQLKKEERAAARKIAKSGNLTWTEKEQFKTAGKRLVELEKIAAHTMTSDEDRVAARQQIKEINTFMKTIEDKDAGIEKPPVDEPPVPGARRGRDPETGEEGWYTGTPNASGKYELITGGGKAAPAPAPKPKPKVKSKPKPKPKPKKTRQQRLEEDKRRREKAFGGIQERGASAIGEGVRRGHGGLQSWTRGILDR